MGIQVLAPDVNESIGFFAAVGTDIRFGLGAVRNVGFNVVEAIRGAREEKGRFESFHDFLRKVPLPVANKRTIESLVKAGAFDSLGATRRGMVEIHESAVESAVKIKREENNGNIGFDFDSLFDEPQDTEQVPDRPEWSKKEKLAYERDMLGLYVSDHPLAGLEIPLAKHASTTIADLIASEATEDGDTVTVAGLITSVQHRIAKKSGNQYGMIQVEDFGGEITAMFMGKAYLEFAPELISDAVVVVRGRVSLRDDGMNLHAFSVFQPELGQGSDQSMVSITVGEARATTDTVSTLGEILHRHAGDAEVRLKLVKGDVARVFELPHRVKVSADLFGELKSILGPNCLT